MDDCSVLRLLGQVSSAEAGSVFRECRLQKPRNPFNIHGEVPGQWLGLVTNHFKGTSFHAQTPNFQAQFQRRYQNRSV